MRRLLMLLALAACYAVVMKALIDMMMEGR